MADQSPSGSSFSLLSFLATVIKLGDERLDDRVLEMVEHSLPAAKSSLTSMFGEGKHLKGAQRLLSNPHVDIQALRECLYACSLEAIRRHKVTSVVSIFDPTLLDFSSQKKKKDRISIGDGNGFGYEWDNALLVEPQGRRVLGIAHQVVVSKTGLDDELDYAGNTKPRFRKKMCSNHPNQFLVIADAVDARLPSALEVIHVADREFDDGLVLRSRVNARSHFVIRGNKTRVVQVREPEWLPQELRLAKGQKELDHNPEGLTRVCLKDLVQHLPCLFTKSIPLDPRGRVCTKAQKESYLARVEVGAVPIRLARKSKRAERVGIPEEPVWLNLVVAREVAAPQGRQPILWLLLTDLPIGNQEEIERVLDLYCCRWRTEEFFRTEKDAMLIEESELDDALSTARLLVFMTFRAMLLDELRFRAEIPAGASLTAEQRRALKAGAAKAYEIEMAHRKTDAAIPALPLRERAVMALGLIAKRGGWAGKSLGNYVLLRGLPTFVHDVAEGRYAWLLSDDDVG